KRNVQKNILTFFFKIKSSFMVCMQVFVELLIQTEGWKAALSTAKHVTCVTRLICVCTSVGGVGIAATQLCQTVQDVTIFGTASASKHETISQGGVTHPIDYRTKDYVTEIRKINPKGVDIVLDPLGGADTQKGFGLLKPLGMLIVFGTANCVTGQKKNLLAMAKTWYNQLTLNTLKLMQTNKAIAGFHLGYITDEELFERTLVKLMELYQQGKIKPRIDSCYHFEEVGTLKYSYGST
uniref:Vesicle amine transport 1 n=1 Tax=Cyprinodon variegatus TaxID=28743 RepID=A0A3Q2DPH5_CYPVA